MDNKKFTPLLILLIVATVLTVVFWQGVDTKFDDANYVKFGGQMLNDTYNVQASPYAYGMAYISTIAASQYLTGSPIIPQILEFMGIIAILYYILIKYFDARTAFVITLSAELSAFFFLYATRVLPDMLLGLIISVVFLIFAYKPKSLKWAVISGFIMGSTVFVKFGGYILLVLLGIGSMTILLAVLAAIVLMFLFFSLIVIYAPDSLRRYLCIAFGFIIAVILYQAFVAPASVFHMAQTYDALQVSLSQANLTINVQTLGMNLIGYPPIYQQIYPLGTLFFAAIAGSALVIKTKNRLFFFALIALWGSILYLYFGNESLSLTTYTFITVVDRYFIPFLPPMCILAGAFLTWFKKLWGRLFTISTIYVDLTFLIVVFASNLPIYIFYLMFH